MTRTAWQRALATLETPVDASSLGALRVAFGVVMVIALSRFAAMGWIDELYVRPAFHFPFWGFEWVRPWPAWGLYLHFAALGVLASMIALGVYARAGALLFAIGFAYVELIDATYYLNHHYAIVLFAVLLAATPCDRALALRPRGGPAVVPAMQGATVPFAAVLALRAQLGVVYVFAGIAKLQPDWLLRAEPLRTWLAARTDMPLVGPLLGHVEAAYAMSWAGAAFDLSIPVLLACRRTRPIAYAAVVTFHLATGALFRIGMFPWVMIVLTPIFFAPDWPRRVLSRLLGAMGSRAPSSTTAAIPSGTPLREPLSRAALAALAAWMLVQVAVPLRHHLYAGDRLWTGEGARWAWHVMIAERAGHAELRVVDAHGRTSVVDPADELTPLQARMMAVEPELLLRYAHHLRDQRARRGERVRVHADVFVSLNGRPSRRLVDPAVDLAAQPDGLGGYPWVYRLEEAPAQ